MGVSILNPSTTNFIPQAGLDADGRDLLVPQVGRVVDAAVGDVAVVLPDVDGVDGGEEREGDRQQRAEERLGALREGRHPPVFCGPFGVDLG